MCKRRIKLTVAYDGTNYCGWQIQPNGITVQEVLEEALSALFKTEIHITGASRTDTGVHAMGNVCVFDTDSRMPADKVSLALNARLPQDIRIQDSMEVSGDFHPRFTSTIKTYEYKILNKKFADPLRRLNSLFWYGKLDLEAMQQAAKDFVGTHDFKSFCTAGSSSLTTVRTIYDTKLWKEEDMIHFQITGNGFLYNMVRIIAGTLLEIGRGALPKDAVPSILAACDREQAGATAQAHGLTLMEIRYPEWNSDFSEKIEQKEVDTVDLV